ncbi:MAG: BrnT family toxin [Alphaproteobacteria bacterium]
MQFEWDEAKAQANLQKHGVDFKIALKVFVDTDRKTYSDDRFEYGEERYVTYGHIDDRLYAVVYTEDILNKTIRLISARKANKREKKKHGYH